MFSLVTMNSIFSPTNAKPACINDVRTLFTLRSANLPSVSVILLLISFWIFHTWHRCQFFSIDTSHRPSVNQLLPGSRDMTLLSGKMQARLKYCNLRTHGGCTKKYKVVAFIFWRGHSGGNVLPVPRVVEVRANVAAVLNVGPAGRGRGRSRFRK